MRTSMDVTLCGMPLQSSLSSTISTSRFSVPSLIPKRKKSMHCKSLSVESTEGSTVKERNIGFVRRRLILLRHAESSWDDYSVRDHDRPLSNTGRASAADVADKLQQLGWVPELILCSDAMRSRETLSIMQKQVNAFLHAAVHFCPSFYSIAAMDGQTADHLQKIICKLSKDDIFTVMCMGHNRGWEEAASMFTGSVIELKTCNAALLEATGKSWEENTSRVQAVLTCDDLRHALATPHGDDKAFASARFGGWKLQGIVKPTSTFENCAPVY